MEYQIHPFEPIYDPNSKYLILGSFPSVKSRETHFYYGNPQNRFWKIIASLFQEPVPSSIAEKIELLHRHHIAVWDTLQSCSITGSSDASIGNPAINDIRFLLSQSQIKKICFNGSKSYQLFLRYADYPTTTELVLLPSSSPANARFSLSMLFQSWGEALDVPKKDYSND